MSSPKLTMVIDAQTGKALGAVLIARTLGGAFTGLSANYKLKSEQGQLVSRKGSNNRRTMNTRNNAIPVQVAHSPQSAMPMKVNKADAVKSSIWLIPIG